MLLSSKNVTKDPVIFVRKCREASCCKVRRTAGELAQNNKDNSSRFLNVVL